MFEPWRVAEWGQLTNKLAGIRLMLMGESHYSNVHEVGSKHPSMTQGVVQAYLDGTLERRHKPFFTKIAGLLVGKQGGQLSQSERAAIWASTAFYNFVPVIAANASGTRPEPWMWEAGRNVFLRAIIPLEPEAILVLGEQLWNNMPPAGAENSVPFSLRGEERWLRWYRLDRPGMEASPYRAVAAHVNHPSERSRWDLQKWIGVVEVLKQQVLAERQRRKAELGEG